MDSQSFVQLRSLLKEFVVNSLSDSANIENIDVSNFQRLLYAAAPEVKYGLLKSITGYYSRTGLHGVFTYDYNQSFGLLDSMVEGLTVPQRYELLIVQTSSWSGTDQPLESSPLHYISDAKYLPHVQKIFEGMTPHQRLKILIF